MTTAVVFGISGYAGSHIANELIARGIAVTGISRNVEGVAAREGLTLVTGDVQALDELTSELSAADAILVALPARGADGRTLAEAVPALAAAAGSAGARLGVVGGAGSLQVAPGGPRLMETPQFPDAFKPEATAHSETLAALEQSDPSVDWFYLSPAATFGAWNAGERTGAYRTASDVLLTDDDQNSAISGADYALAFVDEVVDPAHSRQRFHAAY